MIVFVLGYIRVEDIDMLQERTVDEKIGQLTDVDCAQLSQKLETCEMWGPKRDGVKIADHERG